MDRRNFIKKAGQYLGTIAFSSSFLKRCSLIKNKPNIVLINIDDLGWADVGYQGISGFYETPNIDRLTKEGMVFTNAYAAAANCAPSRACLMTGQNTPRHGIYTVASSARGQAEDRKLIPAKNTVTLDEKFITIPEALQTEGYKCCHAGKWHVSDDPCDYGFDVNIAGCHWGNPSPGGGYFPDWKFPNFPEGEKGEYLTDKITDYVLKFVEDNQDSPFFLNYSPYIVHSPLQGKEKLIDKYSEKEPAQGHNDPRYAAMVETMDRNVGRLLKHLDELGLGENTFLIFTSDNGGVYRWTKQWPLRAGKGSYYEGGIREPLIVRWPGKIEAGTKTDTPVTNLDFYPTILEVSGIKKPADKKLDGKSLLPILNQSGQIPKRPLFWHFPIYLEGGNQETRDPKFRTRPGSVIRYGDWKLHEYFESGDLELYNLKKDIGETNNLVQEYPEKAEQLYKMLKNWRKEVDAPVPTKLNPDYQG
jgi:arylsulfatase A-like enzyme